MADIIEGEVESLKLTVRRLREALRTVRMYEYGVGPCWCRDLAPEHSEECRANRALIRLPFLAGL